MRASIVAAVSTHVGNVRDHNEDAHLVAADEGIFIVCGGMGGHAAGEVASAIGVRVTREHGAGEWAPLSTFLVIGHFAIPFYLLLWRPIRRSWTAIIFIGLWALGMEVLHLYWIVRPMVYSDMTVHADPVKLSRVWLDVLGIVGPLGIIFGLLAWKLGSGPLMPLRDPRLHEGLHHKNYV